MGLLRSENNNMSVKSPIAGPHWLSQIARASGTSNRSSNIDRWNEPRRYW